MTNSADPRRQSRQPHPSSRLAIALIAVMLLLIVRICLSRASRTEPLKLQGETMGTTYAVTLVGFDAARQEVLEQRIAQKLEQVMSQMSPFKHDSEITRFNQLAVDKPMKLSPAFYQVMLSSLDVCRATDGAFDPTVAPLLNLWGFGHMGRREAPPSDAEVLEVSQRVGWHRLVLSNQTLLKRMDGLQLNLGAIAKGYGVDQVASAIREMGCTNYMVEIGGEVVVSGASPRDTAWRIGVEQPRLSQDWDVVLAGVLELTDCAVATSGDYRNYYKDEQGRLYSHILDPRTGYPINMPVAGVTVLAPTCLMADALATALFVMGVEQGLAFIEKQPDTEALFIVRQEDGNYAERSSSGFLERSCYRHMEDLE